MIKNITQKTDGTFTNPGSSSKTTNKSTVTATVSHFTRLLALVLFVGVYGNIQSQTMNYTISDDESKTQNLMVGVSLLDFTMGSAAFAFSAGVDADYYINRFSVEAGMRFSYYDLKKGLISATNESTNKLKAYKDFRVGGRLHLFDRNGKKNMKANLSYEQQGNYSTTTYLPVSVPTRKIIALHFGVQHYNSIIKARRDKGVTASDGSGLSEWQSGTNMGVTMLYGGFSFIDIMKATVNAGGSKWHFKWYRNLYFDALFAPVINIEDVELAGKTYKVQGEGTTGFEKGRFGGRFGYANMASKVYLRYEIGWYPGLAGRGFFTQASFGFSIIKDAKRKPKG